MEEETNVETSLQETEEEEVTVAYFVDGEDLGDPSEVDEESDDDDEDETSDDDDPKTNDEGDVEEGDDDEDDKGNTSTDESKLKEPSLEDRIKQLENDKRNLNTALHQVRQEKKALKNNRKETEEEEKLSPEQIKTILEEHQDDPETLYNVMQYMTEQGISEKKDTEEVELIRTNSEAYVLNHWPDMADENSDLSMRVEETKKTIRVENHPMGDYLALSSLICEELPQLQKQSYEKGKADALKENGIKKTGKKNTLAPTSKAKKGKKNVTKQMSNTAKQMGLSKAQQKIYSRLVKGDD